MIIWHKLIISILICLAVGGISGFFTANSVSTWYKDLNKPSFNPPNYLFGPVWTILYILMGVALYFIWTSNNKTAIIFFIIQLALNFAWSLLFFQLKNPLIALIEILLLLTAMILTVFYARNPTVTYLFIPYILWVSFATILNASIFFLNR
jgi:tryptophan-rich sensory protein